MCDGCFIREVMDDRDNSHDISLCDDDGNDFYRVPVETLLSLNKRNLLVFMRERPTVEIYIQKWYLKQDLLEEIKMILA